MNLGLIPARAGSQGIPNKNLISGPSILGVPLLRWSVEEAVASKRLDCVVVSTNDEETLDALKGMDKVIPHRRIPAISGADSPTEETMAVIFDLYAPDKLVLLQLTSPQRTAEDIDEALKIFDPGTHDSLLSVVPTHALEWSLVGQWGKSEYNRFQRPMRQQMPARYEENGAIYITPRNTWDRFHNRLGHWPQLYVQPEHMRVQVDTPFDLWQAEQILIRAAIPLWHPKRLREVVR